MWYGNSIVGLLVTLAVLGLVAWLVTLLPLPAFFVTLIEVVAAIAAIIVVIRFLLGLGRSAGPPAALP